MRSSRGFWSPAAATRGLIGSTLILALLWSHWGSLASLVATWSTDPRYSHGFFVPLFSLYLIWSRWSGPAGQGLGGRPAWPALAWIGLGAMMHLGGAATNQDWVEAASILASLLGLSWLLGGRAWFRSAWPGIAFLVFMIPLPYRVELAIGAPLQALATHASAVLLQLLGHPALERGNTITLGHATIGVVEACNGLSMLMFFGAVSVGLVLCVARPAAEQALILLGAVPIALVANILRITGTALLVDGVGHGVLGIDFHDLAGYLMMPLALGLLGLENLLMDRLFRDLPGPPRPPLTSLAPVARI